MIMDRLTVEVVKHNLTYISEEMGIALKRSAYSPNIKERMDHSCAILDRQGRTIGQAEHIPVHIGSLPLGLKNTLRFLEENGETATPGDMFLVNDPYLSGTHLNDLTLIRPIFQAGRLVGHVANKAHHVDIGGMTPASINPRATELYQEGIIIPPTKVMVENELQGDVVRLFTSNSRMPGVAMGDLRAQVAANLLGERRLLELISDIGEEKFSESCEAILNQTNQLALAEYAKMPHGRWRAEDYLELPDRFVTIRAEVTVNSTGVKVNFEGTESQVQAPLNAVLGVTTSAVIFAIKAVTLTDIPNNDGFNRTIQVDAPEGTLVNPRKPAPVAGGNVETSQRIVDTVHKALADVMPDRIPAASHGSMNNLMMGGVDPRDGRTWAFYETIGGGSGGRPISDGVDGIQVNMTNTQNTPVEVMEHYYPVQFAAYRFREGSGGAGRWRGGLGIERAIVAMAPMQATLLGERSRIQPWGLRGGSPGECSEYLLRKRSGEVTRLGSKQILQLEVGDTLIIHTAGGGGYGDPKKRDRALIMSDIEDERITLEQAKAQYGSII